MFSRYWRTWPRRRGRATHPSSCIGCTHASHAARRQDVAQKAVDEVHNRGVCHRGCDEESGIGPQASTQSQEQCSRRCELQPLMRADKFHWRRPFVKTTVQRFGPLYTLLSVSTRSGVNPPRRTASQRSAGVAVSPGWNITRARPVPRSIETFFTPSTRSTERFTLYAHVGHPIPLTKITASASAWIGAASTCRGARVVAQPVGSMMTAKTMAPVPSRDRIAYFS